MLLLAHLPYLISLLTGLLCIHLLFPKGNRPAVSIQLIFAWGLGLGISAGITFLSFICFNQLNAAFIIIIHGILLTVLSTFKWKQFEKEEPPSFAWTSILPTLLSSIPFLIIFLLALPLAYQSYFYSYGGWDAWSTWNLKARFMFLGAENWQNMFDPILWRGSPHYPLLLPLINVWGWIFLNEPIYHVPVFTALSFSVVGICLLYAGLKDMTQSKYAILPAITLMTMLVFNKLSLSQYADNVLGFYLLISIYCLIKSKETFLLSLTTENSNKTNLIQNTVSTKRYALLAGLFVGLLSFTKSEGLIAAILLLISTVLYLSCYRSLAFWQKKDVKEKNNSVNIIKYFLAGTATTFLMTIIFKTFYSPGNQTFINGLTSTTKPADMMRLKSIFGFYVLEIGAPIWNLLLHLNITHNLVYMDLKYHGLWLIFAAVLLIGNKKCFSNLTIIFPLFLFAYWSIITFYYYLNTYFEITWWLQVTLHRIVFSLLPTTMFWMFLSLWTPDKNKHPL